MNTSVEIAGGKRKCRACNCIIPKGAKFLLEEFSAGLYHNYNNYCPACSIRKLESDSNGNRKMINQLKKSVQWDT